MTTTTHPWLFGLLLLAAGACTFESAAPDDQELDGGTETTPEAPKDDVTEEEPFEEGCEKLPRRIEEPLVLEKRHVAPGSPDYCIESSTRVNAPVTVEPGVIVEIRTDAKIEIVGSGSLHAVGTEEAPIVFTGRLKAPGSWDGIFFETSSPDNVFDHVIVEYAGGDATFALASVTLGSAIGTKARLAITDTVIRHGAGAGIVAYDGRFTAFSNNTITAHEGPPIKAHLNILGALDGTSTYSGNAQDWISVGSASVNVKDPDIDVVLKKLDVPYRFTNELTLNARLEFSPGTTVLFTQDAGIVVRPNGSLVAVGTEDEPIVFDSVSGSPGSWKGIAFSSLNTANRLEHVVLANGGSPDRLCCGYPVSALLLVGENVSEAGRVTLKNVTVTGSDRYGLYVFKNGTVTLENVTFENNALGNYGLEEDL